MFLKIAHGYNSYSRIDPPGSFKEIPLLYPHINIKANSMPKPDEAFRGERDSFNYLWYQQIRRNALSGHEGVS